MTDLACVDYPRTDLYHTVSGKGWRGGYLEPLGRHGTDKYPMALQELRLGIFHMRPEAALGHDGPAHMYLGMFRNLVGQPSRHRLTRAANGCDHTVRFMGPHGALWRRTRNEPVAHARCRVRCGEFWNEGES